MAITDARRCRRSATTARLEGIIPALESSHAIAWALANPESSSTSICLSGRGDKDLAEALGARGPEARGLMERPRDRAIAEAFARAGANGRAPRSCPT